MEGLRLACLYSHSCTRATALKMNKKLAMFFKKKRPSQSEISLIIEDIMRLNSFKDYKIIAEILDKEPLEQEVVMSYWLGINNQKMEKLNHNFITLKKLKALLENNHLVDEAVNLMLNCAISFGKVIEPGIQRARVWNSGFFYEEGNIIFKGEQNKSIAVDFLPKVARGDLLSIHFGKAREKISYEQAETLKQTSLKDLELLNY